MWLIKQEKGKYINIFLWTEDTELFSSFLLDTGNHNRDSTSSQGGGRECHAQYSGHILQQRQFHTETGHVCGLWKLWSWCRGPSIGLCSVWPMLPSILCGNKGTFIFELCTLDMNKKYSKVVFLGADKHLNLLLPWQINKVVLSKGWRCLECTVCEACGQATDPGRLLLCDDCDISYHTYCLDPPLQNVPKDSWKCKW